MTFALEIAARTLWQEARGEPPAGQQAVAHVLWNRVKDGRWGPNLATVCLWRGQFSGWYVPTDPNFKGACSLADDDHLLGQLRDLIVAERDKFDPTGGALFYYATTMQAPPKWAGGMTFKGQFGHHKFWTDRGEVLTS